MPLRTIIICIIKSVQCTAVHCMFHNSLKLMPKELSSYMYMYMTVHDRVQCNGCMLWHMQVQYMHGVTAASIGLGTIDLQPIIQLCRAF